MILATRRVGGFSRLDYRRRRPGSRLVPIAGAQPAIATNPNMVALDNRPIEILEHRPARSQRRGRLVRRALVVADLLALVGTSAVIVAVVDPISRLAGTGDLLLLVAALAAWIVVASLFGLYGHDAELAYRPTTDDLPGIFQAATTTTWLLVAALHLTGMARPPLGIVTVVWLGSMPAVAVARAIARGRCRHSPTFLQNTVVVGAGEVGQHVARKLLRHPEYGLRLVGFVDTDPRALGVGLEGVPVLGGPDDLREIVASQDVERVLIAFAGESPEQTVSAVRALTDLAVRVDVVPRLYELVGSRVTLDTVEGLPIIGLPPVCPSRFGLAAKRSLDIAVSAVLLVLLAPLMAFIAWRVRRDSPGPVLFRQIRLGRHQREFEALKFRTMRVDVDTARHEAYIRRAMDPTIAPVGGGLHKLEQHDAITTSGRWLRRTSLDELPQLFNVLRGDMSLVGPRPCIPYETKNFLPHHFDRFLVPAGITGLWQVTARAQATFREALDMDVTYARGWSFGLDLRLLCRTPRQVLAQRGAL